jgi:hypothetical protein
MSGTQRRGNQARGSDGGLSRRGRRHQTQTRAGGGGGTEVQDRDSHVELSYRPAHHLVRWCLHHHPFLLEPEVERRHRTRALNTSSHSGGAR